MGALLDLAARTGVFTLLSQQLTNESQMTAKVDYFVRSGYLCARQLCLQDGASITQNAVQRPCVAWGEGGTPGGSRTDLPMKYRLIDLVFIQLHSPATVGPHKAGFPSLTQCG